MIIYGIAESRRQVYGHGDSGEELMICAEGAYGTGGFPPLFATRVAAQQYADNKKSGATLVVVELLFNP